MKSVRWGWVAAVVIGVLLALLAATHEATSPCDPHHPSTCEPW